MVFPYTQVTDLTVGSIRTRLLPWLAIELSKNGDFSDSKIPLGLLDSGADVSTVVRPIGRDMGLDIESGKPTALKGYGGGNVEGFIHEVYHRIFDPTGNNSPIEFKGKVIFTKEESFPPTMPQQTAIWGRISIFRETLITFDDPESIKIWI